MPGIGICISPMILRKSGYTAIMNDYITRVTAEGGTLTDTEKTAINLLTQNADIGEFDRLWVHGLQNQIAARTSVVNALTADLITNVNSTTFTAGEGFQGNGTTMYLDTNYDPSVDGVKYTLNSASLGYYCTLNTTLTAYDFGGYTSVGFRIGKYPNGIIYTVSNAATEQPSSSFIGTGFRASSRNSNTEYSVYDNGALVQAHTITSTGSPIVNLRLLNGTDSKLAFSFIGSGAIDQAQFYTDVQTLATTLGFNV